MLLKKTISVSNSYEDASRLSILILRLGSALYVYLIYIYIYLYNIFFYFSISIILFFSFRMGVNKYIFYSSPKIKRNRHSFWREK